MNLDPERQKRWEAQIDAWKKSEAGARASNMMADYSNRMRTVTEIFARAIKQKVDQMDKNFSAIYSRLDGFCKAKGLPLPEKDAFYDWLVSKGMDRDTMIGDLDMFTEEHFIAYCQWRCTQLEKVIAASKTSGTKERFIELFDIEYKNQNVSKPQAFSKAEEKFKDSYGFDQPFYTNFKSYAEALRKKSDRAREKLRRKK